jgi:hypothetical protein
MFWQPTDKLDFHNRTWSRFPKKTHKLEGIQRRCPNAEKGTLDELFIVHSFTVDIAERPWRNEQAQWTNYVISSAPVVDYVIEDTQTTDPTGRGQSMGTMEEVVFEDILDTGEYRERLRQNAFKALAIDQNDGTLYTVADSRVGVSGEEADVLLKFTKSEGSDKDERSSAWSLDEINLVVTRTPEERASDELAGITNSTANLGRDMSMVFDCFCDQVGASSIPLFSVSFSFSFSLFLSLSLSLSLSPPPPPPPPPHTPVPMRATYF